MINIYVKWSFGLVLLLIWVPIITGIVLVATFGANLGAMSVLAAASLGFLVLIGKWISRTKFFASLEQTIEEDAHELSTFIDNLSPSKIELAIFASAAVGLYFELCLIRWQSSVFEVFAFYKNFSLLACFAGLGLGYAVSARKQIPLIAACPLLAVQMLFLLFMRHAGNRVFNLILTVMPISEQAQVGVITKSASSITQFALIYLFFAAVFLLTALALLPMGQLCGALMTRLNPLRAYGLNLLGSLFGVVLTFILSMFWTPPAVWFALGFAILLCFLTYRVRALAFSGISALIAIVILCWPLNFLSERVYTPYQLLERNNGLHGWMMLSAAGQYYQRVFDLSVANRKGYPELNRQANHYELPWKFHSTPDRVAILAAGSGNDVAAALRCGSRHVDAVDIDPAIVAFGRVYHPEKPYDDPRVQVILNDARAFLRGTKEKYDMVVFSALDSHTLTSQASGLRLDSYVYTVESLKEARALLNPGGVLSLSFDTSSPALLLKIYNMMEQAFDGKPPVCVSDGYACTFLQSKEANLKILDALAFNLHDATPEILKFGTTNTVDVSTDDWPFFYMFKRVYPVSYVLMFLVVAAISGCLIFSFQSANVLSTNWTFMLLGTGFMLIETKAITELGLSFGNTWYVVAIVIVAIMIMAFCANVVVSKLKPRSPIVPYVLLLASLGAGLAVAQSGWLPSSAIDKVYIVGLLTLPVFFSGMIFSILIARTGDIASAMAMNLLGAMLGGLLEYNAMYFGYRVLYVMALIIYALSFVALKTKWGVKAAVPSVDV